MELIQALSKGLSPFWLKKIGFGFTFLLCLILFLKLDFKHEKLDQIDLRHIQDSNFYDVFFADQRIPQLWKNGNYASLYNLNFPENYEFLSTKNNSSRKEKQGYLVIVPNYPSRICMYPIHLQIQLMANTLSILQMDWACVA